LQYKIGDQLELRIERIVPNGFGIGFADGLTVFTPLTASGDRVRVQIVQLKKRIAFAEIVEVLARAGRAALSIFRYMRRLRFSADDLSGAA
jgi:predicted RNA-binding protein with TRAM domain